MDTTHTSNRQLADNINVDPSMISLIRTGRRGKPRNSDHILAMADYLASRCTSLYQKVALSDAIGRFNLRYENTQMELSAAIYDWLSDDSYTPPTTMDQLLDFPSPVPLKEKEFPSSIPPLKDSETEIYYGKDGKGAAFLHLMNQLRKVPPQETIYLTSDEGNEWMVDSGSIFPDLQLWMYLIRNCHCKLCVILPPVTAPIFLDYLAPWLPLYMTGAVEAYFYPRIRDNIYRRTMVLVRNHSGLLSSSVELEQESPYTILTSNPKLIDANLTLFRDYLSKCQRAFYVYEDHETVRSCYHKYFSFASDAMQYSPYLPVTTMPIDCLKMIWETIKDQPSARYDTFLSFKEFMESYQGHLFHQLTEHTSIDICPLASVEDVLQGKVTHIYPGDFSQKRIPYTLETYRSHLSNILMLLRNFPNYYFVPVARQKQQKYSILLKENHYVLVIPTEEESRHIIEIQEPALVQPFFEYLTGMTEHTYYCGTGKIRVIHLLEQRIRVFTSAIEMEKQHNNTVYLEKTGKE